MMQTQRARAILALSIAAVAWFVLMPLGIDAIDDDYTFAEAFIMIFATSAVAFAVVGAAMLVARWVEKGR